MTYIFDGRGFAKNKELRLKEKVVGLKAKGIIPKLDSIIIGDDPASVLYQNLKQKAAERIGAEIRIKVYPKETSTNELVAEIKKLNDYPSVTGIMVQLPLPNNFSKEDRDEILNSISQEKDVDGLRENSEFTAPTAKAVVEVFAQALKVAPLKGNPLKVVVIGASGFEGKQIVKALRKTKELKNERTEKRKNEFKVIEVNSKTNNLQQTTYNSDVIISVTGVPGLVKADMVKDGAILIDVGAPKGDIEKEAYEKASFVSPVPGGVGPITISCLLENLIKVVKTS